jgi:hypothetical protein
VVPMKLIRKLVAFAREVKQLYNNAMTGIAP